MPTDSTIILLLAMLLLLLCLIFLITGIKKGLSKKAREEYAAEITETVLNEILSRQEKMLDSAGDELTDRISFNIAEIRQDINQRLRHDSEENRLNRKEVSDMISRGQEKMDRSLKEAVREMQEANRRKLDEMQSDINTKLDMSLNERLDKSFKTVGDQLNDLYKSLGALAKLENGVNSLNKTLSNVKTRGIFGETTLESILSDVLAPSLYDKNVVTKQSKSANRDAVEFAVRIPDKETAGEFMYLPIDSKFPLTIYDKIREASEASDPQALNTAVKELEQKVKLDAKDIEEKYLDPPYTTDFGIMFLPTESLYAEVLRIAGLVEECRNKYHVIITGPSTAAALISSLSIGFRYMAVNRDSQNILKLLSAIKSQYQKLSELIDKADSRIELAGKATAALRQRTDIINKKLMSVEDIDAAEARKLLGVEDIVRDDF